jgi:hypothetical protein
MHRAQIGRLLPKTHLKAKQVLGQNQFLHFVSKGYTGQIQNIHVHLLDIQTRLTNPKSIKFIA